MNGITVISTALNAERYAAKCVRSVATQMVGNVDVRHYYVDAASDDLTAEEAASCVKDASLHHYLASAREMHRGLMVIRTPNRCPLLHSLQYLVRSLPPDEIVVWLDGDDWLATDVALARVATEYKMGAMMTYGSFVYADGRPGFAAPYSEVNHATRNYRQAPWYATHLKTFRAGLFQQVPDSMLQDRFGKWFELAVDQAVMFPMLELAGPRAHFIPDVLYVYNAAHSFERNATHAQLMKERDACLAIRSRQPMRWPEARAGHQLYEGRGVAGGIIQPITPRNPYDR